ncbi:MAG: bifunctional UDP-N-acetylglucosamine diphosphorylase/glucosamine-1-phosphate N-acetyltransferase GlmU [Pseudomonadota bacterium]
MSRRPLAIVILAAGAGTRMRSALPKVMHRIAGRSLLGHVISTAAELQPERLVVVTGHGAEAVGAEARAVWGTGAGLAVCHQAEQRGTGHAVLAASPALDGFEGDLLVLYGDTPLLTSGTLEGLLAPNGAVLTVLGFEAADPGSYGRLVLDAPGALERIVEAKDASPDELALTACNSGVMAGDAATMLRLLARVTAENAQGEYYLTDIAGLARGEDLTVRAVFCDGAETQGVNDRVQLAAAEAIWQGRARRDAMLAGASLIDPKSVYLSHDTALEADCVIAPNVVFGPGVRVGRGARVEAFCHLADCTLAEGATVGPFARLRGGTEIGVDAHVGNFVEMKNASFGPGAKAGHLTYLGDAAVGERTNIGAGTITCNYDGVAKHRTEIGEGAFIGTNTCLIAPLKVGDGAYVATGAVLTSDVPEDALAIARARQVTKPGRASLLRRMLSGRKTAKPADGA